MAPDPTAPRPLHVRWLGTVRYQDANALQHGLYDTAVDDHLLLSEHKPVYTLGVRADEGNVLVDPASVGAELVRTDRGGDVTYHGPGQLVGYPILHLPGKGGGTKPDSAAYVHDVEQLVIDSLADLGLAADRLPDYPGVWVGVGTDAPRKVCAIGVRLNRGRTLHGFGLNVDPDLTMFNHIVPCGIPDKAVTSLRAEGIDATMAEVVDVVVARATERWGAGGVDRHDVVWRHRESDLAPFSRGEGAGEVAGQVRASGPTRGREATGAAKAIDEQAAAEGTSVRLLGRLADAGVAQGLAIGERKPEWMRAKARMGEDYLRLKQTMRQLDLVTVCEEAGCPNIYECWQDGTATFMINGERCTRACGFCLVDTRHPQAPDPGEPERVATAVEQMGLRYAVLTTVARDDLADGGASQFAATIAAIRRRTPGVQVETLISDCKGDPASLDVIFEARPEVLNHNIETVARLQRAVRPSASYARSLALLARAKAAGLTTKSSLIVGMGETFDELVGTLADLRGIGVDIVTIGQYLRPTTHHLPVARWVTPEEFAELKRIGEAMGIDHVESGPLTRSSYHARQAADAAEVETVAPAALA
ncbi:lipoyl synthase [Aquihabitans sp. G128]|uniref:lipoyl synthase n=1 Tax=Aquihabitans sp. G128 TaxID=2849779 RepID=UPI001C21153C|nr:lipoyl synthase [Aquihabitans sp. G128]QXC61336.1 lipoyl synthase [Aquihabitans sp. G128]